MLQIERALPIEQWKTVEYQILFIGIWLEIQDIIITADALQIFKFHLYFSYLPQITCDITKICRPSRFFFCVRTMRLTFLKNQPEYFLHFPFRLEERSRSRLRNVLYFSSSDEKQSSKFQSWLYQHSSGKSEELYITIYLRFEPGTFQMQRSFDAWTHLLGRHIYIYSRNTWLKKSSVTSNFNADNRGRARIVDWPRGQGKRNW